MDRFISKIKYDTDEAILKKMYDLYLDTPIAIKYLKKIGVSEQVIKDNIVKIYDFVMDCRYCSNCPGLANCKKDKPLLIHEVIYKNDYLDINLSPCKQYLKDLTMKSNFIVSDFNDEWWGIDLKNINKNKKRTEAILAYASYLKGESNRWIYLTGAPATGRSYLACAIALDLAKRNKGPIAYLNAMTRFNELNSLSYKDNALFLDIIDKYSKVNVLVIDDFGNELKTDVVRESIIFNILNKRSALKLLTIFTSDFDIDDIVTMLDTNKSSGPKARQIGRLLKANCQNEINLGEISLY